MQTITYAFQDFYHLSQPQRLEILLDAIQSSHAYHFTHNTAYRISVTAKGIGEQIEEKELVRVLRPTSQVFKSYIDILGTPFPHHKPQAFIRWLEDNLSITIPPDRSGQFKERYPSLESFLMAIETVYADLGLEIGTSSGTSGRSTIMVHDHRSADKAAEAYQHAVYSLWGTFDKHQFLFVMPSETRIVMARIARTATARLGMGAQAHFTIPFSASPDQVRVRTGRLFEPGFKGMVEQKVLFPFMNWMNENYVKSKYVNLTIDHLERLSESRANLLLFGGYVQLHHIYYGLRERGYAPDDRVLSFGNESILGTGGGMKELYPHPPAKIIEDLQSILSLESGNPIPHRDVYGMAEANWAAAQCEVGNYHIPPWVHAVIIDAEDEIVENPEATGLLAFYDPFTDTGLHPNFYKTADRVTLVNGGTSAERTNECPCGVQTAYIRRESIFRQDRLDEAGCAGQI